MMHILNCTVPLASTVVSDAGCSLSSIQGQDKGQRETGIGCDIFIMTNTKQERNFKIIGLK